MKSFSTHSLFLAIFVTSFLNLPIKAQVIIGEDKAPNTFSILELVSKTERIGGLRMPQLSTTERDALGITSATPNAEGLIIYNTTINCLEFWSGAEWISLCSSVLPPPPPEVKIIIQEMQTPNVSTSPIGDGNRNIVDHPLIGSVSGDGPYISGSTVNLTATSSGNYRIKLWEINGITLTEDESVNKETLSFTMPSGDVTVKAIFVVDKDLSDNSRWIYDWADLADINNDLTMNYKLFGNLNKNNYYYEKNVGGWDMPSAGWRPLGSSSAGFTGKFDGNNKAISSLWINKLGSNQHIGLFGYAGTWFNNTTLFKNLTVNTETTSKNGIQGGNNAGIIVGELEGSLAFSNRSIVDNCHTTGLIIDATGYMGGLVGDGTFTTFTNCSNSAQLSIVNETFNSASLGGIAGRILVDSELDNSLDVVVSNCFNTGSISGLYGNFGGIVGECQGSIEYSYNSGNITISNTGSIPGQQKIGGIAGILNPVYSSDMYVMSCYNTGILSGTNGINNEVYIGGIAITSGVNTSTLYIKNCYNTGNIIATGGNFVYVGGIASEYYNPSNNRANIAIRFCHNSGTVSGFGGTGSHTVSGIFGRWGMYTSNSAEVTLCYSLGSSMSSSGLISGYISRISHGYSTLTDNYARETMMVNGSPAYDHKTLNDYNGQDVNPMSATHMLYSGWDNTNVWEFISGRLPILRNMPGGPQPTITLGF